MSIIKLNEGALLDAGLPKDFVETMRHLVRQAGTITLDTTLPEVANQTDGLTPIVTGLTITVTKTNVAVANLETNQADQPLFDRNLARQIEELQSELAQSRTDYAAMAKVISEIRDELAMGADRSTVPGNAGTATTLQTARFINGVSFNGSADITVADATKALLAGSASQAFTTAGLTTAAITASGAITNSGAFGGGLSANLTNTTSPSYSVVQVTGTGAAGGGQVQFAAGTTVMGGLYGDSAGVTIYRGASTAALVMTSAGTKVTAGFGCNTKAPQAAFALGAAATDLASVISLANNLQTMAINNGMGS